MGPWLGLALIVAGWAETPLPDYPEVAARAAARQVDALVEQGQYTEAIARATAWERGVRESAGLAWRIGRSHRFLDDPLTAERHLRRAVALDPTLAPAWGDLGDVYLAQGRFDEAAPCFERVTTLRPTGPGAAMGPRRLAEIAAWRGDPEAFEDHIREALKRGFTFREIAGLPNWQRFYADPGMRDAIGKMVTVYGDRAVLDTLVPASTATVVPEAGDDGAGAPPRGP